MTKDHTALPAGRDIAFMSLGVLGIGTSGPVIANSLMPVPTLIFWRNLGGAIIMSPFALAKREWQTAQQRSAIKISIFSGFLLALHFMGFFIAMRFTSVAAGTALTAVQPIFTAIYLRFKGGTIPKRAWGGMAVAFLSVLLITGIDIQISFHSFLGDLAALIGAALAAAYMLIGSKAQESLSTSTYTTFCYGMCAATALPIALFAKLPVLHFPARQWVLVIALILGAQILGHTMFNFSLKRVSPAVVSLIVFFEVPVSAILAYFWLGQKPPAGIIPGIVGLLIGCGIFVFRSKNTEEI
jgi:drug/metabolite transporter (DMT)-like permease